MAVSLEVRAPLLDYRLVELAARIPSRRKLHGAATKGFFRSALSGRLSESAARRPKQGFSVPLRSWMAGPLAASLERATGAGRLEAFVDVGALRGLLARHRAGVVDNSELLARGVAQKSRKASQLSIERDRGGTTRQ